jgi:hypothetical protein
MKIMSKDVYCDWDSPKSFCSHHVDDRKYGLQCMGKIFDDVFQAMDSDMSDEELEKKYAKTSKCPFKSMEAAKAKCKDYGFVKYDKNTNAKRYIEKDKK